MLYGYSCNNGNYVWGVFNYSCPISETIIKVCWRNDSGVFFVGGNSGTGGGGRFLSVNTCDYWGLPVRFFENNIACNKNIHGNKFG